MTKFCSYQNHNVFVMLLAALILASMMVNSQCRLITSNVEEEQDDSLGMKFRVLDMSSRDEIVQMAGYGEEKLSTVLITGAVVCNKACMPFKHSHHQLSLSPQPISGALVGAACRTNKKDKNPTWAKGVTDKYGDFIIDLPSHLHAIRNLDMACSVKILELPKDSPCQQSDLASKHKEIKLASVGNGIRTYTAGRMEYLHIMPKNSETCMMKPNDEQETSW